MKTMSVLVTTLAVLLAAGCSTKTQPTFADDLAAITGFNERYLAAINNEDIAALSALTTDGHIMLVPNSAPVVGKAANDAMNGGAFARYEFSETWQPVETVIDGDLAFQRGTFTTIATPRGDGDRLEVNGSFMRIYQRQANGDWRMTRDMFNSSTPLAATLDTGAGRDGAASPAP
ncbi:MAG TPA: nuclear transport factor 2 family protein [Gammaproteobacteria bacterium]|jgi:ketosteroid isomerase-like protein|nr:nuclear transport factor 2 family protein [Gammaproteobacteria bacterium]